MPETERGACLAFNASLINQLPALLPLNIQQHVIRLELLLQACHGTGIVHRDVKPQNCILSERDRTIKLIDLGAAADLRIGINYIPNEYLLDPRYAPPQQYIMSTQACLLNKVFVPSSLSLSFVSSVVHIVASTMARQQEAVMQTMACLKLHC